MKKLFKKIVSLCLTIILCLSSLIVIHASEIGENCSVTYSMSGDVVVEQTRWSNLQGVEITKRVNPDGSGEIVLQENGKRTVITFGGADYSKFVSWVENPPVLNGTDNSHSNTMPAGSDLIGSQYKHVQITTNGPITYTRPQMQSWLDFADAYTTLAVSMVNMPSIIISTYAQVIFNQIARSPERVTIRTIVYEVLFSYDNVYYTHCYHMSCQTFNPNSNYMDFIQVVGG